MGDELLDDKRFDELYRAYRKLFWYQLSVPIASVVILAILSMIFREHVMEILCFGSVCCFFIFVLNLIFSQFFVGKLWHKYVKLYKQNRHPSTIVAELFH